MKQFVLMLLLSSAVLAQQTITKGTQITGGTTLGGNGTQPPPTLISISVVPVTTAVITGAVVNYTATGNFSDGSTADVTTTCAWASSNTAVATIGTKGNPQQVNAVGPGTANITCTIGTIVGAGTLNVGAVIIITTQIPTGTVGTAYSVSFQATGGFPPYTFSITSGLAALQALGLSFTSPTLSGTPTAPTTGTPFTVQVQDTQGNTSSANFTLVINPAVSAPVVTTTSCPSGIAGQSYTCTITATGGTTPYTWSVTPGVGGGAIPSWATLNQGTPSATITGSNPVAGSTTFGLTVTDNGGLTGNSPSLTILINTSNTLQVTTTSCPLGTIGVAYTCQLVATGGSPPYTWSIDSGILPTWATLNAGAGTITGTPSGPGSAQFTVLVRDSTGFSATSGTLTITVPPVSPGTPTLPQAWANPHTCDLPGSGVVTKVIHADGSGDYACAWTTFNGKGGVQQAWNQWASDPDEWFHLVIDDAGSAGGKCDLSVNTPNGTLTIPAKAVGTGKPTKCFVMESAHPNATGQTLCSHSTGTPTPSQRNFGCTNDIGHTYTMKSGANVGGNGIINIGGPNVNGDGPSHFVIRDAEIATTNTSGNQTFVVNMTSNTNTAAAQPSDWGFERDYFHGDVSDTGTGSLQISTMIFNGCLTNCWIEWNYFDQIGCFSCSESHIMGSTNVLPFGVPGVPKSGGYKVAHNFFEGSMIPFFVGGAIPNIGTGVPGYAVMPGDMEIRQNLFTHSPAWIPLTCSNNLRVVIKSNGELKVGNRLLYNGNEFAISTDGPTGGCGQHGQNFTVNVRACSAGIPCDDYNAEITDLTFTNNVLHAAGNGIESSGGSGAGAGISSARSGRRWLFFNNLIYDTGSTAAHHGAVPGYVFRDADAAVSWQCPIISRTSGIVSAQCTDGGTGLHATNIGPGDAVEMKGCTQDTSLNTGPALGLGPLALAGTNGLQPNGLNIVYPKTGADFCSTTETCTFTNFQGRPDYYVATHNTVIVTNVNMRIPSVSGTKLDPAYATHALFQDDLIAPDPSTGWSGLTSDGAVEGAQSEAMWDTGTLTMNHLTFPFRASKAGTYLNWDGQGNSILGNAAGSTEWFPALVPCPNATVTTTGSGFQPGVSCDGIGFAGMMSGAGFLLNSSNPLVDYALQPYSTTGGSCSANCGSPYAAGGPRQSSDGADLGANMSNISTARTENQYSGCGSNNCGTTGPFTD